MEQSLENRLSGNARRSAPSHSGCGRLKPPHAGERPTGGIPADRPQRHRKTETALTLADTLFGGEKSLSPSTSPNIRSRIPSPSLRGLSGLRWLRSGRRTYRSRSQTPYSVVLLDEVEKAHRDVMNLSIRYLTGALCATAKAGKLTSQHRDSDDG